VMSFLVLYYGVTDSAQLAPPSDDLSHLAPTPPAVYAGATQSVTPGQPVELHGSALDETVAPAGVTALWSPPMGGPRPPSRPQEKRFTQDGRTGGADGRLEQSRRTRRR